MLKLAQLPLKQRLTFLMVCITGLTLLCSFLAFSLFERAELRGDLVRDLRTQTQVLSQAVAADLDFGNLLDSTKSLQFLATNKSILASRIFDAEGQVFTSRESKRNRLPLPDQVQQGESATFHDGVLDLYLHVYQDGQLKGTLFVRSDTEELHGRFLVAMKVMSAGGLGLLALVLVAAAVLQRQVSDPILELALAAQKVSLEKNFSIRLARTQGGELGVLSESFNEMLDHIQNRDAQLLEYQNHLEELVLQRSDQLLQTKQLLTATLDALPASIAILDDQGTILATNQKWERYPHPDNRYIHGLRVGAACLQAEGEDLTGEDTVPQGLRDVLTGKVDSARIEYDLGLDDAHRWYVMLVTRFTTLDTFHVVLMHMDISEQKRLELQLRQAQKLESIGQLAAGIAHEINTPTQYLGDNAIFLRRSFHELMELLGPFLTLLEGVEASSCPAESIAACRAAIETADLEFLREEVPKALEQSMEGVDRVSKIVRAMKEFSHPGTVDKVPCDLNRAIETTALVCRSEWKYVADLALDLDPGLPKVPCLPDQINQVLLNLMINAAYAIAEAGQGRAGHHGTIKITTRAVGAFAELAVEDSGTGIPEAIRARIFDPFFTTKPVGKGTGQGLAIAYSIIVKQHGGTIAVKSDLGKGTTFTLRLPFEARHGA